LQVEHPVTEFIWGVDMVELQFRVGQGEKLRSTLDGLTARKHAHAMELRLCAEDSENNFLPSPGPITDLYWPEPSGDRQLRIDSGFEVGDVVAQEYDSLFAKMILCSESRDQTITGLSGILKETRISGLLSNKYFLNRVLDHPDFKQNSIFTRWIQAHPELTKASNLLDSDLKYWGKQMSSELLVQRNKPRVPLPRADFSERKILLDFLPYDEEHGTISPQGHVKISGNFVLANEERVHASGWVSRFEICIALDREIHGTGQRKIAFAGEYETDDLTLHHGPIVARVPGVVLDIRAGAGDMVKAQDPILVIEAMKIEMPMSLPIDARITTIHVKRGDRIQPGQTLVTWEPSA
jgi:acetyl/propionyl-CoA carboxylase alpha subunit